MTKTLLALVGLAALALAQRPFEVRTQGPWADRPGSCKPLSEMYYCTDCAVPLFYCAQNGASWRGISGMELIQAAAPPAAPKVTLVGAPGTTAYGYRLAFHYPTGETLLGPETLVPNGPATLDADHYLIVQAPACAGIYQSVAVFLSTAPADFDNPPAVSTGWIGNLDCGQQYLHNGDSPRLDNNYSPPTRSYAVGGYGGEAIAIGDPRGLLHNIEGDDRLGNENVRAVTAPGGFPASVGLYHFGGNPGGHVNGPNNVPYTLCANARGVNGAPLPLADRDDACYAYVGGYTALGYFQLAWMKAMIEGAVDPASGQLPLAINLGVADDGGVAPGDAGAVRPLDYNATVHFAADGALSLENAQIGYQQFGHGMTCNLLHEGMLKTVWGIDPTAAIGDVMTAADGASRALGYCDGVNWIVVTKPRSAG